MPDDERTLALVERWEELRQQGVDVSPEELCAGCPELLGEVRRFVGELEQLGPVFEAPGRAQTPPTVDRRETVDHAPEPMLPGPAASADARPAFIGKCQVIERLGRGGQAEVFRAVFPGLPGRDVVIK
jgi:hypothetical protein